MTVFTTEEAEANYGTVAEIEDIQQEHQVGVYVYWCEECTAKHWGVNLEIARKRIKQKRNEKGVERMNNFKLTTATAKDQA